jgi:hypothetical protein
MGEYCGREEQRAHILPARTFSMNGTSYIDSKTTAKELNEFPVAMLLVMGLQGTFPCQTGK